MTVLISEDPKKGTTTVRHTWRSEVFMEFGQDPEIKAHRAETTFDTDTLEPVTSKKDRQVVRRLADLPDGQRQTVLRFFELMDTLEAEDLAQEKLTR